MARKSIADTRGPDSKRCSVHPQHASLNQFQAWPPADGHKFAGLTRRQARQFRRISILLSTTPRVSSLAAVHSRLSSGVLERSQSTTAAPVSPMLRTDRRVRERTLHPILNQTTGFHYPELISETVHGRIFSVQRPTIRKSRGKIRITTRYPQR